MAVPAKSSTPADREITKVKILLLSLNSSGSPFPKIASLLMATLSDFGCQVNKLAWGRHSESETLGQKVFDRFGDLIRAFLALIHERFDILFVMTTLDEYALARDIPLLLATYLLPVKKVLIQHGSKTAPLVKPGFILYKFLTRLLIRLSDAILLLSTEELESWADFEPKGQYYRVDNPFIAVKSDNLTNIFGSKKSCPTLLFVGRLIKQKGIFDLLDAMPLILRQIDCHLLIAGDGEERKEIKRYLEKANLEKSVTLLGYLDFDHLCDIYRSASVFVLPTYFGEGFPGVIVEAMSFGLPIVTTPIRGSRDHLQDGIHALFVNSKDPDAIAEAVLSLLNDPKLCSDVRCANLNKVKEFAPENVVPKYVEIFSQLLGKNEKEVIL